MSLTIPLSKARPVITKDDELTPFGFKVLQQYASQWIQSFSRNLDIERRYPELESWYWDIRTDPAYAINHALPIEA